MPSWYVAFLLNLCIVNNLLKRTVLSDIVVPPTLSAPSENSRYIIPKGHVAVATPAFTQVDKRIWYNNEKWDPYRWADPNGEAALALQDYLGGGEKVDYGYGVVSKGTDSVYQPFGAGRHRCIGEQVSVLADSSKKCRQLICSVCLCANWKYNCHVCEKFGDANGRNSKARLQCMLFIYFLVSRFLMFVCLKSLFTQPSGPCTVRYRRRMPKSSS
jgi:hypothetical protein